MAELLKKANFEPHLNSTFQVQTGADQSVDIELIEISDKSSDQVECFSLIFKGPLDKPFMQCIYKLRHPQMGEPEIFLVPITYGKSDSMYYQAVFNRVK
jgi:hypothetical protein